ncbi:transposase, partial [Streptomyces sp. NPDC008222]|uniref:transposase n=1 Tax=Streptomyces sp. NPDC008222 TaxID=3364820 RepID=UPI0036E8ADBB
MPLVVVADAGYGPNADFRACLAAWGHAYYVVGIRVDLTGQPHEAHPAAPPGPAPAGRRCPATDSHQRQWRNLATTAGREAFEEATWREGSRGPMTSRFLTVRVRPAGVHSRRPAQAAAVAEHGRWDGGLPEVRLLTEGPTATTNRPASGCPTCPRDTPVTDLVRLAKIRGRIEHDYRELKHGLGLGRVSKVPSGPRLPQPGGWEVPPGTAPRRVV